MKIDTLYKRSVLAFLIGSLTVATSYSFATDAGAGGGDIANDSAVALSGSLVNPQKVNMPDAGLDAGEVGSMDELTAADKLYIEKKGKALYKYLYEQKQLEELNDMLQESVRVNAIKDEKTKSFPMNPDEISDWRSTNLKVEQASNAPISGPVEFKIKTIDIDVDAPKPIQILVAKGYSSSIMFFDETGAPWPINGDIVGDRSSFESAPFGDSTHVGVFKIHKSFSESNALINLKDMNVPIVIRLTGSESVIDSRVSVRIPKFGPNANVGSYTRGEINNANPDILSVLNGDKLDSAKMFQLNGVAGTVWYKNGTLYVRTLANLMSPPWKSHVTSPTGYNVYELPPVVNLLFAVDGQMKDATISNSYEVKLNTEQSIFKQD